MQMLAHVIDFLQHDHAVADQAFVARAMAKIRLHRRHQSRHAPHHGFTQGGQVGHALGPIRRVGAPSLALPFQQRAQVDGWFRFHARSLLHGRCATTRAVLVFPSPFPERP